MATDIIARGLAARLTSGPNGTIPDKFLPTFPVEGGTAYAVGGIPVGTELNGFTYEQVLSMMLYGIVNPTLTEPSFNVVASQINAIIGSTTEITGTAIFNRGAITPAYGTSGFRSGLPTSYIVNGAQQASTSTNYAFSTTLQNVVVGNNAVSVTVNYAEGEQPKDSTGRDYDTPLEAGSLNKTIYINGTYPIFATTTAEEVKDKECKEMPIDTVTNVEQFEIELGSESGGGKQCFGVSELMPEIKGIQQYNTVSKEWGWIQLSPEDSLGSFTVSTVEKTFFGKTVTYKMYTNNLPTIGPRRIKIFTVLP